MHTRRIFQTFSTKKNPTMNSLLRISFQKIQKVENQHSKVALWKDLIFCFANCSASYFTVQQLLIQNTGLKCVVCTNSSCLVKQQFPVQSSKINFSKIGRAYCAKNAILCKNYVVENMQPMQKENFQNFDYPPPLPGVAVRPDAKTTQFSKHLQPPTPGWLLFRGGQWENGGCKNINHAICIFQQRT